MVSSRLIDGGGLGEGDKDRGSGDGDETVQAPGIDRLWSARVVMFQRMRREVSRRVCREMGVWVEFDLLSGRRCVRHTWLKKYHKLNKIR
jgi:hypothetical protein